MRKNTEKIARNKNFLHIRNKHKGRYDFPILISSYPSLNEHVFINDHGIETIDFHNPNAVKALNTSLLIQYYGIKYWDIPEGYLCPPIPGRADYIHYTADLLAEFNNGIIPKGNKIRCLDIGTGANCIYPILGKSEYGWSFVGSDIDQEAIDSAKKIIALNPDFNNSIEIRIQENKNCFFQGIIDGSEIFDLSFCNPPFHSSAKKAKSANKRKIRNLNPKASRKKNLNFGGQSNELWTPGGEERFLHDLIHESRLFGSSVFIFTTLVSQESSLPIIHQAIKKSKATYSKTISMNQGNKKSRLVSWSFLDDKQMNIWVETRWN